MSKRILIIDDSPHSLQVFKTIIDSMLENCICDCVSTKAEFLDKMNAPYDFYIIDYYLKNTTGLEIYEELLNFYPAPKCMIITEGIPKNIIPLFSNLSVQPIAFTNRIDSIEFIKQAIANET